MSLVNFTNLDFDQIKTSLKDYLRSNPNFTDYDFEGSNLSTILDVLAYNTYITSYNANMVANEVFIDSATLRENVVALARNIGYVPRPRRASKAIVSFFVDTSDPTLFPTKPSTLTLKKGLVATSVTSFDNQSFVFSILDDITVPVVNNIALFENVTIYEGNFLTTNFTYSSNNPNQRFILPNIGIDTNLISVSVKSTQQSTNSVRYNLKEDIFDINGESKVFFIQEIEDERYQLIFGDGYFGKKLENDNYVEVNYVVSNGNIGNGINQFNFAGRIIYNKNGVDYTVSSGISLLTTNQISSGGDSIESVESIKKYAPKIYAAQNRALTSNDYESLIPSKIYKETDSISVFGGEELDPPQYGKVFISIKPKFGDFLPDLIKQNIKNDLRKYAVAGIVPEILDLNYLFIEANSKIYYNTNLAPTTEFVSSIVQNNVNKYAESTELNRYGARFKYSKFLKIIDDSHESITSNITTIAMRRDLRVLARCQNQYKIDFGNEIHIANMSGYNIKSSSFKVTFVSENVYISDIPNADKMTGTLFLFTVPSINSGDSRIVSNNIGTIDYKKGILNINSINIISTGKIKDGISVIEISAIPKSNDVIGLQNLYLQLDINNSSFEVIPDQISSGADPSASNYIITSSYANGNLVRS